MTSVQLIFLDIDGVIRTWPYTCPTFINSAGRKVLSYNMRAVAALNWLCQSSQAQLVVSSTWREMGILKLRQCLADWRVTWPVTSLIQRDGSGDISRGKQIALWMARWSTRHPDALARGVILDDDLVIGPWPLIRMQVDTGLTWGQAYAARDLLMRASVPF